jgi:hypothetical protein
METMVSGNLKQILLRRRDNLHESPNQIGGRLWGKMSIQAETAPSDRVVRHPVALGPLVIAARWCQWEEGLGERSLGVAVKASDAMKPLPGQVGCVGKKEELRRLWLILISAKSREKGSTFMGPWNKKRTTRWI